MNAQQPQEVDAIIVPNLQMGKVYYLSKFTQLMSAGAKIQT